MSPGVVQVRADICGDCATPCADWPDVAHACAACPIRKWGKYGNCDADTQPPPPPAKMRGLGDLVALVADPISRAIGVDKAKCGCAKRQETLNQWLPFNSRPQKAYAPPTPPSAPPSNGGERTS